MFATLHSWLAAARRHHREQILVGRLLRMSDHHLADIGLRRDQLQPDGIHDLDAAPSRRATPIGLVRQRAARPSLQGCG